MDQYVALSTVAAGSGEHESFRAMNLGLGTQVMRFYLGAARAGYAYRPFSPPQPAAPGVAPAPQPEGVRIERLRDALRYRLEFESDPLPRVTRVAGLISGELAFVSNQTQFDFGVTLFELTPQGEYLEFCSYWARAGQGADHTRCARPNGRRHLSFQSGRRLERLLAAGSRIVVVLGTRPQSCELDSVKAVGALPRVHWHGDSFIEVPLNERPLTR
jgi:predicted acyl esterase